jgi:hypothetical protein
MKKNGVTHKSGQSHRGKGDLKPAIAIMDKLVTRIDRLDKKIDSVRKEAAQARKETKREIQSVRKDMKQDIKSVREDVPKYYLMARDENRIIADEHARTLTKTYTTMDAMAKDYSRWLIEKQYNDVELERHSRVIKELAEKGAEKDLRLQDL